MTSTWDGDAVQRDFKRHEQMKYADADHCKIEVRAGKDSYKRFHDEELAEALVAFMLGTDAALASRERLLDRLAEFKEYVAAGSLRAAGIYDKKVFEQAAIRYLERLESRYAKA